MRAELVEMVTQPSDAVLARLQSGPNGLSSAEASRRLRQYGPNVTSIRRPFRWSSIAPSVVNPMALLIWATGLIALLDESILSGVAIWAVNLINLLSALWQELQPKPTLQQSMLPLETVVQRDGTSRIIPTRDVVPGDLLLLAPDQVVPADAYLLEADRLFVDQAHFTGTLKVVPKSAEVVADYGQPRAAFPNLVLAGARVTSGIGHAVVLTTGAETVLGQLVMSALRPKMRRSPLWQVFASVARTVTLLAVGAGLITLLVLIMTGELTVRASVVLALSIIVAFVPEGLLPTIAGALSLARRRLARHDVQVRRSAGLEALGEIRVLCVDKTGTLTENAMTVTDLWLEGEQLTVSGTRYRIDGTFRRGRALIAPAQHHTLQQLLRAGSLASTAKLLPPEPDSVDWQPLGDRTEAALLVAAHKAGLDPEQLDRTILEEGALAFDAQRGWSASLRNDNGQWMAYLMGNPTAMLPACSTYLLDGVALPLNERISASARQAQQAFAERGLRVIAVAQRPVTDQEHIFAPDTLFENLTLLGLFAAVDPPRPEVTALIAGCRAIGLPLLLVTGDHPLAALTVARNANLVRGENVQIVSGQEIASMDAATLRRIISAGNTIFAPVGPRTKARLIELLQQDGTIVGMLGDGTNDAPALQQADAGIALAAPEHEVAIDAADLVLPPGRPDRLLLALDEGRAIFANLRKLLGYLFAHNMAEAVSVIVAAILRLPPPLLVLQVLAIDLGSELLPAVALAGEPPEPLMMHQPPRRRSVLDHRTLIRSLLWIGLIEGGCAILFYLHLPWTHGWRPGQSFPADQLLYRQSTTLAYLAIVTAQLGNVFASRSERASIIELGWLSNLGIIWAVLAEVVLVLTVLLVPNLRDFFGFALPPVTTLPLLIVPPVLVLVAEEFRKGVLRRVEAGSVQHTDTVAQVPTT